MPREMPFEYIMGCIENDAAAIFVVAMLYIMAGIEVISQHE
jgi:hypothetical protein